MLERTSAGVLSDEQLAAFGRDGYIHLGRIVDEAERQALLAEEARFRPERPYGATGASASLFVRDQLCHHSEVVRRFCTQGRHLDAVAQLLGPDVAFTHTQFITKLPGGTEGESLIPLHQDDGYGTLDPPIDVTVWTALTETTEQNGCLVLVPGSHTDGVLRHDVAAENASLRSASTGHDPIPVPLGPGEAVAFSGLTLHGSGPNRSDTVRVGMHARYCLPSALMVTEGGRPVLSDPHSWMVRGDAPLDQWHSANDKFEDGTVGATS